VNSKIKMEVDTSERERKNGTHKRMTSDIDTTERWDSLQFD